MITKRFTAMFFLALMLACPVLAQRGAGLIYHEVQVVDEFGRKVTDITSVTTYTPGTTTPQTIYMDMAMSNAITQPMTTTSTNTTLASGAFYWWGPSDWDFTVTDGTYTHVNLGHNAMTPGMGRIVFPSYLQSISSTTYTDAQTATFGSGGDFVLQGGATADRFTVTPAATDETAAWWFGANTTGIDVFLYATTTGDYIQWDASDEALELVGAQLHLDDDSPLQLGSTAGDIVLQFDGTNFLIDASTADEGMLIGDVTSGFDVTYYFETAGQFRTDYDGDFINLTDDMDLRFGTGASADGDFQISSNSSNVLTFGQIVAGTGTIAFGVDDAGVDVTLFGDTASSQAKWDANGDTNGSLILTGASQTITGIDSGGNLLTITGIDTTGNSDTVVIAHSGTGDALQITCTEADSVALNLVAAASQTTSVAKIDAATSNWDGANDVGMLHLVADDPVVHTGASLLQVVQSGQPIAASEGHLARFVSSGIARTDAYAVEIETTNTTPALMLNNQMTISAADSAGTLFDITAIDTTGNSDTMTIAHSGTGAAIQITSSEADTQLIELISAANQTTWLQVIDGAAGNWIGANDVGMLHLKADTALANAGAAQLLVSNAAQPISAAEGFLARFVDTGTARTNAYAIDVEVTDTTGGIYCDGHSTFTKGLQTGSQTVIATADGLTTGLIPDGASFVTVTSDTATKVVVLPAWVIGNVIRITVPATGAELQTLATSNDTINGVDCDGTNEMAMAAGSIYELVCVADSTWIAYGWSSAGAAQATIVPDADA